MKFRAGFFFIFIFALSLFLPRGAFAQQSGRSEEALANGGTKGNSTFSAVDALFEKAEGLVSSVERCVDSKSDLTLQASSLHSAPQPAPAATKAPAAPPVSPIAAAVAEKENKLPTACAATLSVEQILNVKELTHWTPGNAVVPLSQAYFLCVALAKQDEAACDGLAPVCADCPVTTFHSMPKLCRNAYARLTFTKALITRDPSAKEKCLKQMASESEKGVSPAQQVEECELILSGGQDAVGACAKAAGGRFIPSKEFPGRCEKGVRDLWGLEPCTLSDPWARSQEKEASDLGPHGVMKCIDSRVAVDYRKSKTGKNPELCGSNWTCRAMMTSDPAECKGYASQIQEAKRKYCASLGPNPIAFSREEALQLEKDRKRMDEETAAAGAALRRQAEEEKAARGARAALKARQGVNAKAITAKIDQLDKVCLKKEEEGHAATLGILSALNATEPKNLPGLRTRILKYNSLKADWGRLNKKLHPADALRPKH